MGNLNNFYAKVRKEIKGYFKDLNNFTWSLEQKNVAGKREAFLDVR